MARERSRIGKLFELKGMVPISNEVLFEKIAILKIKDMQEKLDPSKFRTSKKTVN